MRRAPTFASYTPAEHERVNLGLHVTRPADEPTLLRIAITANLVATNASPLKIMALDGIAEGRTRIVIDLASCRDIDSRGFGVLVGLANRAKRHGGSVTLLNVHEDLQSTMNTADITKLFTIGEVTP